MHEYLKNKMVTLQGENKDRIETLKREINIIINRLYNEITNRALDLDKYRIPIHGISNP